jgi:hypothetical protein
MSEIAGSTSFEGLGGEARLMSTLSPEVRQKRVQSTDGADFIVSQCTGFDR